MRVLHITPSYAPAYVYGGPIVSLEGMVSAIASLGVEQRLITTNANGSRVLPTPKDWTQRHGVPVLYVRRWFAPDIAPRILSVATQQMDWADVVHVSSVFCLPSVLGLIAARTAQKPTVLSVHGALQPGAMKTGTDRKRAWLGAFRPMYETVDCFHATAGPEADAIRQTFGESRRIVEIPNGTSPISDHALRMLRTKYPCQPSLIGMLGRLHPIKAVDRVLEALAILHRRGVHANLQFAGPVQDKVYRDRLVLRAKELGLSGHFELVGPQFGAKQVAFYSRCAVLVVASHSENFSNVVIEALNVETPVVASLGTPWAELPRVGCGAWVENRAETLADAIAPFLASPDLRRAAGAAGRQLVQKKYTWPTIAQHMAEAYEAVVRNRQTPPC